MSARIERRGKLIHECGLAGERRSDGVFPGHANAIPVARDRWLLVVATRGWRRVDDDRSITYQVRRDAPDGPLLCEGMIRPTADDWDPFGDGSAFSRNQGHPVAFGVPKGALTGGTPAPHANLFAVKWRVTARHAGGGRPRDRDPSGRTQFVEWMQCRLNDAGDDIEVLQPPQPLRERGYDGPKPFSRHADLRWMNQSFVQPVPFNADATEWVDCNHFDGGRVAALRYRYNPASGLYEWMETGPLIRSDRGALSEASVARTGEAWLIAMRSNGAVAWVRTGDPFGRMPEPVFARPAVNCPLAMYTCADGAVRILAGEVAISPYGHGRCPLYVWEVDPETFALSEPQVVHDPIAEGLLPRETGPRAEMCKVLPHMGGAAQHLVWRVRTKNVGVPYGNLPPVTEAWKEVHGIYHGALVYDEPAPPAWEFGDE